MSDPSNTVTDMGLDAFVACTCYRDGLTSEPPITRDQIVIDDTGKPQCAWIDSPYSQLSEEQEGAIRKMIEWTESACEHEDMDLVSERIGNISSVGWLRAATSGIDDAKFAHLGPILSGLSGMMDSRLQAAEAEAAMPELEQLLQEPAVGATRTLQESGDGYLIETAIGMAPFDDTVFHSLGPASHYLPEQVDLVVLGVRGLEFVVRARDAHGEDGRELFSARMVEQVWHRDLETPPASDYRDPVSLVTFRNIENDASITVKSLGIRVHRRWPTGKYWEEKRGYLGHYPRAFFIGERKVMLPEVWVPLTAIQRLFRASIRTGNPVVWG